MDTPLMTPLRRWRLDNGWSLSEAADLAGVSEAFLSRLERGERSASPETKVRLARSLGARVRDLFDVDSLADEEGPDAA